MTIPIDGGVTIKIQVRNIFDSKANSAVVWIISPFASIRKR